MNQLFNYFGQAEVPKLTLCNPHKDELYTLALAQNIKNTLTYNALSQLEFTYPQSADGGTTKDDAYAHIRGKMVVLVENIGYYVIDTAPENLTGTIPAKDVKCTSLESELNARRVNLTGTYVFTALLQEVLNLIPTWTIGTIDPIVAALYRTFNSSSGNSSNNQTVYNFLTQTVEKAYGCVFTFDSYNRTVSAVSSDATPPSTNIYLSFENLIKAINYTEKTDELCTALHCYGGGGLDIHNVNPLGGNVIYDFSYFKTIEWMSQGLIDALSVWETQVAYYQPIYANLLTQEENYNIQLSTISADLTTLFGALASMYNVQTVQLQQGLNTTTVNAQIAHQKVLLTSKQIDQANIQQAHDSIDIQLRDIVHKLYFSCKLSYDNFLDDATTIQSTVKTMIAEWMLVYNNNTYYPDFNPTLLANSAPALKTLMNTGLAQATTLVNSLTAGYSSYPPVAGDILIIAGYINNLIATLQSLYSLFKSIIPSTEITISLDSMITILIAYRDIISYPGNMTSAQYLELCSYIYENSYANNNIIITTGTNGMTPAQIQQQSQYLYDQSLTVLIKVSEPRYEFTGEFSNFIVLQDYLPFTNELELGSTITVKKDDDETTTSILTPVLLEISVTWDNPTEFTGAIQKSRKPKWGELSLSNSSGSLNVTFGNRMRPDDEKWAWTDYTGMAIQLMSALDTTVVSETSAALVFTPTFAASGTPPPPTGSGGSVQKTYTWPISTPAAPAGIPGTRIDRNCTVALISAYCVGGTSVTFNIEERSVIGSTGTDIMGSNMVAVTTGTITTAFSHASLTAGNWLWLKIASKSGVPTYFVVTLSVVTV